MAEITPDFMKDFDLGELDWGITTVSSKPDDEVKRQSETIQQVSDAVSTDVTEKLNLLLEDTAKILEVATRKFDARLEERQLELDTENQTKFQQLEKLTLPLLYNLYKTSDEAYIHWPNRKEIIQGQIEKILKLTRD
tara:strand:+ start:768 stop:1178 length:411 start_codon:yes stop_codon:yes gene_type:complete